MSPAGWLDCKGGGMPTKANVVRGLMLVALAAFASQSGAAQTGQPKAAGDSAGMSDVAKAIKAAADAMGMPRTGGPGGAGLPEVDVINRMEFWGSGTISIADPSNPTGPRT